jgi:glycosyltransferase involved in cell wall biosynthesis
MKVLHCTHSLSPLVGGPSRFIEQAACLSREFDMAVEVACLDSPDETWIESFPCPVHAFGPALGKYGYSNRLLRWLSDNAGNFDVVVVNGIWQYTSLAAWLACRAAKAPYVVFPHGMLDPWFNAAYRLKHLKKLLYWLPIEYRVLRDAAAVFFTAEEECERARLSFQPYNVREVVVGYGTTAPEGDPEGQRQVFARAFPELSGKRVLLFLGRVHEKKGCDLLVDAFTRQTLVDPEIYLVIAGPHQDDFARMLLERVKALRPDVSRRIVFTGMLSGEVKWGALRSAEVLCLPSHQENFAQVVSEALSCGTPVLISDKVNIWREIVAAGAGIANSDDLAGTEASLKQWLGMEQTERARIRDNARACFERSFEIHGFFRRYREQLQMVVSASTEPPQPVPRSE